MLPLQRVLSVILTGLLLGALLAGPSTSAARVKPAKPDAAAESGHIDVPDELRKVLPRGTVLYYAKVTRKLGTQTDHWVVEALDVNSGKTWAVMTDKTSGLDQLQPRAISPDRRFLLIRARTQNHRKILIELELATGNWRLLRENSFHGQYSPDGKRLVIDYQRDPKTVSVDPVLRTGIIDRNGNLLQTLPCDAKRCYHPVWNKNGNEILYAEGQTRDLFPGIRPELARLRAFNVETGEARILADYPDQPIRIIYPDRCNGQYLFMDKSIRMAYIPELERRMYPSNLIIINQQSTRKIEFSQFTGFTCIEGQPSYLIVDNTGEYKFGPIDERMRLDLFHIPTRSSIRITPGPTLETDYFGPVISLP